MSWFRAVAHDAADIAWGNRFWLTWNTMLAMVPALLAVPLFRARRRWGPLRALGVLVFVLFLPNAPYVVTDLVHLRGDVVLADSRATVYLGILPMYAAFIAVGFACYAVSLAEVGRWLRRTGRAAWVWPTEIGLHALCALGVLLGRVARLNSWDTFTQPEGTLERALATLSWEGSTSALVTLFLVIWGGHAVTRGLGRMAAAVAPRRTVWAHDL
jgi:uncharacterized membrane protein